MADEKQKSKKVKLRVTRRTHTFEGKTYGPGDTFMGTERMLEASPDRLELASNAVNREADEAAAVDAAKALKAAEKERDEQKAAAEKAVSELEDVKKKLAEAEAQIEELTKAPAKPEAKKNADASGSK